MLCNALLKGSVRVGWKVQGGFLEEEDSRWKSSPRKSKARADGSEWPVLTLEIAMALECLMALAGLRGGSLHSARGTEARKCPRWSGLPKTKYRKIMSPMKCEPVWASGPSKCPLKLTSLPVPALALI